MEILLSPKDEAVIDAVRLAFALNSFPLLPATLQRLAGRELSAERVRDLVVWAWDEQVQLALVDDIITEAELDMLSQSAVALGVVDQVRGRPSYGRLVEGLARQRAELAPPKRRHRRSRRPAAVIAASNTTSTPASDDVRGEYPVAAVGESHYQPALLSAAADRSTPARCDAALVPEPTNQYDANAVRVDVRGECVGYLNRSHARIYRDRYGERSISCKGLLCGGDAKRPSIGIWLAVEL